MTRRLAVALTLACVAATPAYARHHKTRHVQRTVTEYISCNHQGCSSVASSPRHYMRRRVTVLRHQYRGAGIVRSAKTGATAHVAPGHAAAFQAYIDDLESHGAVVRFMGGYRAGVCSPRHEHPCGKALDVCQLSRGRVDARCHLPGRQEIASIAERHGLFEGGRWCNQDYGHAQVDVTAPACGSGYASAKRRRHHRMASR